MFNPSTGPGENISVKPSKNKYSDAQVFNPLPGLSKDGMQPGSPRDQLLRGLLVLLLLTTFTRTQEATGEQTLLRGSLHHDTRSGLGNDVMFR